MESYDLAGPYSSRNSMNVPADVERLLAEPEFKLDDDEKILVKLFGIGLSEGAITGIAAVEASSFRGGKIKSLGSVNKMPVAGSSMSFSKDYFKSESGQLVATSLRLPEDAIAETLFDRVAHGRLEDKNPYKLAEKWSNNWFRETLTADLGEPGMNSYAHSLTGSNINLDLNPDRTLDKAAALQAYRKFYRQVRSRLNHGEESENPSNADRAKRIMLDVHTARINALTALHYPRMMHLAEQLALSPGTDTTYAWRSRMMEIAPVIGTVMVQDSDQRARFMDGFARRLDLVRNGRAKEYDQDGNALPTSRELLAIAAKAVENLKKTSAEISVSKVSKEELELLIQTTWNAQQFAGFLELVLMDQKLLSEHVTNFEEFQERTGPAADDKWQVVISPKEAGLIVLGSKKAMVVAENFDRSLIQTSPSGPLLVGPHEFTHVLQAEANIELANDIPLSEVRGRRSVTGEEMGGLKYEKTAFLEFGLERPLNIMYLRGLQAKLGGSSIKDVARVMYETLVEVNGVSPEKARKGARGVLRLYRHAGHNSQPLDYLESEVLAEELSVAASDKSVSHYAITGTAFSLSDAARLHQADIYQLPTEPVPDPTEIVLRVFRKHYLQNG